MEKRLKKSFCLVSMLLFLFVAPAMGLLLPVGGEVFTFEISDSNITVGESFDLTVKLTTDYTLLYGDLLSFGFDIDPLSTMSFLRFDGYLNDYIDPDYFHTGTYFTDTSDGTNTKNVSGAYDFFSGTSPQTPTLALATLRFTALGAGTESIFIQGDYEVINGISTTEGLIYLFDFEDDISETFRVQIDPAVVPEPSTFFLLGAGLLGLGSALKKR